MFGKKKKQRAAAASEVAAAEGTAANAAPYDYPKIHPDADYFSNFMACLRGSGQSLANAALMIALIAGLIALDVALPTKAEREQAAAAAAAPAQTVPVAEPADPDAVTDPAAEAPDATTTAPTEPAESAENTENAAAAPAAEAPQGDATVPAVAGALPVAAITATDTLQEAGYNYDAANLLDGDSGSCWAAHGTGARLTVIFDGVYPITGVSLCNGYGLDANRYYNNNRVTKLRLMFGDSSFEDVTIDADAAAADFENGVLTEIPLTAAHEADSVEIEILEVAHGAKFDDTCLSELAFTGGAATAAAGGSTAGAANPGADGTVSLPGGGTAPASDFIFPASSASALTNAQLDAAFGSLGSAAAKLQSQRAINEIYARYGYNFHPEKGETATDAYNYFNGCSWYTTIKGGNYAQNTGEVPVNGTEAANIQLIAAWQSAHGLR